MASSGTLLSDLEGKGSVPADNDLVRKILSDMNAPSAQNPVMGSPMPPQQVMNSPNPNTTAQLTMDSQPATSHIIGKDHPTAADFAAAMYQRQPEAMMAPTGAQQWGGQFAGAVPAAPPQAAPVDYAPKKNIYARVADEVKTPILVALLVFLFSLPAIHVLFSHYIPSMVKPTGDLTSLGLLTKSVLAGATFWVLQRVVAPLISL